MPRDTKRIMSPEINPKSSRTFEKRASGADTDRFLRRSVVQKKKRTKKCINGILRAVSVPRKKVFFKRYMLFYFRNIVWHVIDHVHVEIIRGTLENFCKSLPCQECHSGAIYPGVISSTRHAFEVILAFLWADPCTCELKRKWRHKTTQPINTRKEFSRTQASLRTRFCAKCEGRMDGKIKCKFMEGTELSSKQEKDEKEMEQKQLKKFHCL